MKITFSYRPSYNDGYYDRYPTHGNNNYYQGFGPAHRPGYYPSNYPLHGYGPNYGYGNNGHSGSYAQASAGSFNTNNYYPYHGGANSNAHSASFSLGPFKAQFSQAEAYARSKNH